MCLVHVFDSLLPLRKGHAASQGAGEERSTWEREDETRMLVSGERKHGPYRSAYTSNRQPTDRQVPRRVGHRHAQLLKHVAVLHNATDGQ